MLEAQPQPTEEQSLLDFDDEEDTQFLAQKDSNPVTELVRVDSASSVATRPSIPEYALEQYIDSEETIQNDRKDQLGDDLVLQCAQETLSRATSLYEESLYEGSVGDESASEGGMEKQLSIHRHSRALRSGILPEGELSNIEMLDIPETRYLQTTGRRIVGSMGRNKRRFSKAQTPTTVQILPALTDEPLNMPFQIQASFRKLQDHFQRHGSSTIPKQLAPRPVVPITTLPPGGKSCSDQRGSSKKLVIAQKSSQQQLQSNEALNATSELSNLSDPSDSVVERRKLMNTGVFSEQAPRIPLRYLRHIEQEFEELSSSGISPSRHTILEDLLRDGSTVLPTDRVALTGRLGIGKTYIAAAHVHRLMQRFEAVPIFWISVPHIEEDCTALSELLRLKCPKSAINPWNWLSKIIASLPRKIVEPWLLVVDGVNLEAADNAGLHKLLDVQTPQHGYLMMTTRHHSTANRFLHGGLKFNVETLNGEDAGNLLASKSPVPRDFEFDIIARALDFDPFVTAQISTFLEKTGMPLEDFSIQLELVLDDRNWAREGQAAIAAKALSRKQWLNDAGDASSERYSYSALVSVLGSILNPSWLILFDAMHEKHPAAAELLSIFSVLGRIQVPEPLLAASAGDKAATGVLLDQCFLTQSSEEASACRLMLIAHRVWLMEQDKMEAAYRGALKMVANEYPAVENDATRKQCELLEPFAQGVLSDAASSWIPNDITSQMYISMLREKRKTIEPN